MEGIEVFFFYDSYHYNLGLIAVAAHLTGIHSAIKMLNSRIRVLHHYLLAMQKGTSISLLYIKLELVKNTYERGKKFLKAKGDEENN
jgi:hypothetical protein